MALNPLILKANLIKYALVGAVIAAPVIYHFYVVRGLESDLKTSNDNLTEMTSSYEKLAMATQLQNSEILRLSSLGSELRGMLNNATKNNAEIDKKWRTIIGKLNVDSVPEDCGGALNHLRNTSKALAKEWNK